MPRANPTQKTIASSEPARRLFVEPLELRLMMDRAEGVDVSQFQGSINWTSVFNAGKRFAFVRSSRTNLDLDPNFVTNMTNAKAAGVLVGPYHRVLPQGTSEGGPYTDPLTDAQRFVNAAGAYMITGYLRPVIDVEDGSSLGKTALTQWVLDFIGEVKRLKGVTCTIYCNTNYATNFLDTRVKTYDLWIARPGTVDPQVDQPPTPVPFPNPYGAWNVPFGSTTPSNSVWDFWQYSLGGGTVPGISGGVDLDVFNGDLATLQSTKLILPPEITVSGAGGNIADGQAGTIDFGVVKPGATPPTRTFTVRNDGESALSLGSLVVPTGFSVTDPLVASLLAGESDTFTIQLNTTTAGNRSGQISFTNNDPSESPFNFPVTGIVDGTAPTCNATSFDYQSATRAVRFTFSENVQASLSSGDLTVTNLNTNAPVFASSVSYDSATNTATFLLPGLADATYQAVLASAGVSDRAGNALSADAVIDFFVLSGDANHDRTIDTLDFNALAANFGGSGKTYAQGDFNFDGVVDTLDFNTLAAQFGKTLAPPQQQTMVASAAAGPVAGSPFSPTRLIGAHDRLIDNLI